MSSRSQKSTYSFFEDLADINVLDEASDEEDLNSSCGESRAYDCGEPDCLVTIEQILLGNRLGKPCHYVEDGGAC